MSVTFAFQGMSLGKIVLPLNIFSVLQRLAGTYLIVVILYKLINKGIIERAILFALLLTYIIVLYVPYVPHCGKQEFS